MIKDFLLLLITLCAGLLFLSGSKTHALSCMQPQGDEIQKTIKAAKSPIFFGQAVLVNYDKENFLATFEIENTYFTNSPEDLTGEITMLVPGIHQTWGRFADHVSQDGDYGIGKSSQLYLVYNKKNEQWVYRGPGACTFFTKENWKDLKSGKFQSLLIKNQKEVMSNE